MAQTLGRYILERTLAVGGMGEVFHARQTGPDGFDRTCVVKTMHPNLAKDAEIVGLFLEEARLTARLSHPHVAQVYDFGKIDTVYYIAMERVDGPSLHTVVKAYAMRAAKVPIGPVLRIVSQAAQALDYVHRLKAPDGAPLNLVHRDISPGNLLLSRDGLVKLIDFGIAKASTTARQTAMGQIRGKLAYMSPEQMLGQPLDGRTDIYSLGLVLYELLSGRRANPGRNEVEIMMSVKTATLAPIQSLRSDCPPSLAKVLQRATARDRDQRYARAGELSQALEQALLELGQAVGPDDLTAVAEQVDPEPPRPSPRAPRASLPDARTQLARPAPPTSVEIPLATSPNRPAAPSRRGLALAVFGALFMVAGGGLGALWAASAHRPQPAVVVTPPPPPAQVKALSAAAVTAVKDPEPAPAKPKPRWAKKEKFERRDPEPPAAAVEPAPEPLSVAAAATGTVEVTSEPPTEVYLDGQHAGVTPAKLQLAVGTHRVELREPRLKLSWVRTVDVTPMSSHALKWRASQGLLDVRPVPPHVELQIFVDGVSIGHTPISAFSVWEGARTVAALNTATGWKTEQRVEITPGARLRIKVNDGNGMEINPSR